MMAESLDEPRADAIAERIFVLRRALEGIIGVPATEGNRIEVLRNGNEIFPAMLENIAGATRTIDLLTFIYWRGEIGRWEHRPVAQRVLERAARLLRREI